MYVLYVYICKYIVFNMYVCFVKEANEAVESAFSPAFLISSREIRVIIRI
jgi:hypothetical protein